MINKILNRKQINPSQPTFTGVKHEEEVSLQLFSYNNNEYIEDTDYSEQFLDDLLDNTKQHWVNIHGIHDVERIKSICTKLNIHQLAIQDILDINQRPKFQEYETYWFFSIKSMLPSENNDLQLEQLSFILGNNYLISFQEKKADHFNHIRERIRQKIGIIRERGTDYLLYLLFESILDNYTKTINDIEIKAEDLGLSAISENPSPDTLLQIETLKRQTYRIRKIVAPFKELISKIEHEELALIEKKHVKYFYEIKDLCLALIDDCDQLEIKLESSVNLFFSIQGHRMNQVMKTLTVVATIFIPLTFIAGIYGMNFSNMPELNWEWGYFGVWCIIIVIFSAMLLYFKKKKWY